MSNLAAHGPTDENQSDLPNPPANLVFRKAAELYGSGYKRSEVARILQKYLVPQLNGPDPLKKARRKLRDWEQRQDFRDLIWELAVVKLDLRTPEVLAGLQRKARAGRVDAAKLVLEVTGRHTSKSDVNGPVQVNIGMVARPVGSPERQKLEIVDGEARAIER